MKYATAHDAYEHYRAIGYTHGEIRTAPMCDWCEYGRLLDDYSRRVRMCESCREQRTNDRRADAHSAL